MFHKWCQMSKKKKKKKDMDKKASSGWNRHVVSDKESSRS